MMTTTSMYAGTPFETPVTLREGAARLPVGGTHAEQVDGVILGNGPDGRSLAVALTRINGGMVVPKVVYVVQVFRAGKYFDAIPGRHETIEAGQAAYDAAVAQLRTRMGAR